MNSTRRNGLRILLTEDHASTRLGIKQILKEEFPQVGFGEAADASGTLALLDRQRWDLLVLDISLPDRHGMDLLPEVKRRHPELPVLIYSGHAEDQFAAHALRAGAAGYLTKERAPEDLSLAVRTIIAGGKHMSPLLAARLAQEVRSDRRESPRVTLSEREFQVLRLTVAGKSGKTIAAELGLNQKTASTYRTRILRKLRIDSVAELVQYAVRRGLV